MSYFRRLLLAVQNGNLRRGQIGITEVLHDERCPALIGPERGCRCMPKVMVTTKTGRVEVLEDGTIRPAEDSQ